MAGHGAVLDLGGAVTDHQHRIGEARGASAGVTVRLAAGAAGADCGLDLAFQAAAGLKVQRLVDGLHAHPHALVVGMLLE